MRFTAQGLQEKRKVTSHQGGEVFTLSPEQELVKLALTSFLDKSFYETMNDKLIRLRNYCSKVDVDFLIKLATWAREKGMRTVNQVMLIESLAHKDFGMYFDKLVRRPDEIIDMVGYYVMINNQHPKDIKLANKLKKAIKNKLEQFSEYQLAKYKSRGDVINIYDLVNMTHANSENIDKLKKDELSIADTWESQLSKEGNTHESWNRLLEEEKLGALAFIRNLRNIIEVGIDHKVIEGYLGKIDFTKLFPFQTIQAVDRCVQDCGLTYKSPLYKALEQKIYDSFDGFAELFEGKVAIGIDISGSMDTTINNRSVLRRHIMAGYYGMALREKTEGTMYLWGTQCFRCDPKFSMENMMVGGGTNFNCLFNAVQGKGYDTLLVITDEQAGRYGSLNIPKDIKNIIIWNLADYSNSVVPTFDKGFTYITGFSDAQFEIVKDLRDLPRVVKNIKALEF